jgi:hypothetical protein
MQPPGYFNNIQRRASERWDQLERDPDLAGPWHQLFRQVQSPRHVVSELLQNADDAGAKSAFVRVEDNVFIFEHDGNDFDAEQFTSLCRFGFSNKRTLHTIGFRGVGFKSTFSLGDTVEVRTPTLAVCFKKKRFTEPVWLPDAKPTQRTIIQVRIADRNRAAQLRRNFEEWAQSPASLLFFNNLKALNIERQVITRQLLGKGPVAASSWAKLGGADAQKILVVQSEAVRFPNEAAEEIRAERGVVAEDLHLPPCRVEIVLGLSECNRLYVVLPTGAELSLPFSCNAPFIQDPARFAIKDPATSPTNRWLLERAGGLAGQAMLQWVGNDDLSLKDRAAAYEFLLDAVEFAPGLDGTCSQIIMENMLGELKGRRVVLTTNGKLAKTDECVAVPEELFAVWESEQLMRLFAPGKDHLLASAVSNSARSALRSHGWLEIMNSEAALQRLEQSDSVPRPAWPQLHALWSFVQNELHRRDWDCERRRQMKIVPVGGSKVLHSATNVIRLSSRRDLLSGDDWKFVMDYAHTIDADWLTWISKRAPKDSPCPDAFIGSKYRSLIDPTDNRDDLAYTLLHFLGLHEPSTIDRIVAQASLRIFSGNEIPIENCVRVAHIMAALNATVPSTFRFVTRDRQLRECDWGIICDETGRVEDLTPAKWAQQHLLHEDYTRSFVSCKREAWQIWIRSKGSCLLTSMPIVEKTPCFSSRCKVKEFAISRGGHEPKEFHYRRDDFTCVDYGFDLELFTHFARLAKTDATIWSGLMEGILTAAVHLWDGKTEAEIRHNGKAYYKNLDCGVIPAEWILHFRSVACLPDTHGKLYTPAELLLRNPDTEPLMGVEPFVKAEHDNEGTKPLLKLLGVRDTPTDPDKLLARLHGISTVPQPIRLIAEISRIYEALDRIVARCAPAGLRTMDDTFAQKELIFTENEDWVTSNEVSIYAEEGDASPTIHHAVRNLAMWPRIGISDRPAVERTIEWLKSLGSGAKLDATAAKRVRAALQRDPVRIWNECGHWLTLDSTWERIEKLKFRITMQSLMKWGELFPAIKSATANLQMLSVEVAQLPSFVAVRNLGEAVEFRVTRCVQAPGRIEPKKWLAELADGLCRAKFSTEEDTNRVKAAAQRLRQTTWCAFTHLDVTPYVEGAPAGEPFTPKALWQNLNLYVAGQSTVKLYKELADELARPFSQSQVSDAIAACIDRTPEFVAEYLEAHFQLDAQPEPQPEQPTAPSSDSGRQDEPRRAPVTSNAETPASNAEEMSSASREDEAAGETQPESTGTEDEPPEPTRPPKPTLIELYAKHRGFHWHPSDKCFTHANGQRIEKSQSPFNWEERDANGELLTRLWVTDQKLANGVEIAAELWTLLGQQPSSTTMVVVGDDHAPYALTGQELLDLKDSRQITLHPARYRIVEADTN